MLAFALNCFITGGNYCIRPGIPDPGALEVAARSVARVDVPHQVEECGGATCSETARIRDTRAE